MIMPPRVISMPYRSKRTGRRRWPRHTLGIIWPGFAEDQLKEWAQRADIPRSQRKHYTAELKRIQRKRFRATLQKIERERREATA